MQIKDCIQTRFSGDKRTFYKWNNIPNPLQHTDLSNILLLKVSGPSGVAQAATVYRRKGDLAESTFHLPLVENLVWINTAVFIFPVSVLI